jgi:hypothetical protein
MKANWDKYPWANYRAQDSSGTVWYYENEPDRNEDYWYSDEGESQKDKQLISNWKDTLEKRSLPAIKIDEEVIILTKEGWKAGVTIVTENNRYYIKIYDLTFVPIEITPITIWKYISNLEITL